MKFKHEYDLITKPNLVKRSIAGLLDYSIVIGYLILILYLYGEPNGKGGYSVSGFPSFSVTVFWFIMTVIVEQLFGATVGNRIMNLRAAPLIDPREDLKIAQSIKRHLLDLPDLIFYGLIAILTIKKTVYNQRLGDLWAGTVVLDVSDPEQGLKVRVD